jgi:TonB family protein
MRNPALPLALLILAAATTWAQQELPPSTDQGPIAIKPAAPTPDKDGVYRIGDGITPPVLTNAVAATYPPDAAETDHPHITILSLVVGVDGTPANIQVVNPHASPFDEPAIAAVQQSRFQPGALNGKPVPVLVNVRVPFFHFTSAVPRLMPHYAQMGNFRSRPDDLNRMGNGVTPPRPIVNVMPEYSDQARRQKIQGVVVVSMLVTEDGLPTDFRVEKSLGYGLDEKALQAAARYRFKPAMRDGNPVSQRIMVEMNFRLY